MVIQVILHLSNNIEAFCFHKFIRPSFAIRYRYYFHMMLIIIYYYYIICFFFKTAIVAEPYLFIMFGFDHNHKATSNTWVIDTRAWKWVTSINKVEPAPPSKGIDDKDNNNEDNNNENYIPDNDDNHLDGFVIAIIAVTAGFAVVYYSLVLPLLHANILLKRNTENLRFFLHY